MNRSTVQIYIWLGGGGWGVCFVFCVLSILVSLVSSLHQLSKDSRINKCFHVTYVNYFYRLTDVVFLCSGFHGFINKKNNLIRNFFVRSTFIWLYCFSVISLIFTHIIYAISIWLNSYYHRDLFELGFCFLICVFLISWSFWSKFDAQC